jgi:hypothetical protein
MRKIEFLPCILMRGIKVPAGPDWLPGTHLILRL